MRLLGCLGECFSSGEGEDYELSTLALPAALAAPAQCDSQACTGPTSPPPRLPPRLPVGDESVILISCEMEEDDYKDGSPSSLDMHHLDMGNDPCWTTCLDMLQQVTRDRGGRSGGGLCRPVLGPQFRGKIIVIFSSSVGRAVRTGPPHPTPYTQSIYTQVN